MECYNITAEEDEDPSNIDIKELEGHHEVNDPEIEMLDMMKPLKTRKVNIGSEVESKYATIRYYQEKDTINKIKNLLHEYQELFPTKFLYIKGILGDLGVMGIPLKSDVKPIKQRPYRLNPKYMEKVKEELDKMLKSRIIEPFKQSEWVSPMVVQEKKAKVEIIICVDLRKLNDVCLHDPFPTLFTNQVLDNVGGKEVYSFTDGFLGYHHIRIVPEDRHKTNFVTEWDSYQYMVMPFGLKNGLLYFLEL